MKCVTFLAEKTCALLSSDQKKNRFESRSELLSVELQHAKNKKKNKQNNLVDVFCLAIFFYS